MKQIQKKLDFVCISSMMQVAVLFMLLLLSSLSFAQSKQLYPSSVVTHNFGANPESEFAKQQAKAQQIVESFENGKGYESLTAKEKQIVDNWDETKEHWWETIGGGCSWYCGGGPISIVASSYLPAQGKQDYVPENAHDFRYDKVWSEGKKGDGIGEFLDYTFPASSPRITKIFVVNGHVKSESAWRNNSRVKKLKMYIDGEPYAILNLKDSRSTQGFDVGPIGESDRGNREKMNSETTWTLRFEILEVYKGEKYSDVVISELYFDGIDVHCFAKGTQILMSNGSLGSIEELEIGDSVTYCDLLTQELKTARIKKLEKATHQGLVRYVFQDGESISATKDHPFYLIEKGWSSLQPVKSRQYKGFESIDEIAVGDRFLTASGSKELKSIEYLSGEQDTYTISKLSEGANFIANGLVVGVEELNDRVCF